MGTTLPVLSHTTANRCKNRGHIPPRIIVVQTLCTWLCDVSHTATKTPNRSDVRRSFGFLRQCACPFFFRNRRLLNTSPFILEIDCHGFNCHWWTFKVWARCETLRQQIGLKQKAGVVAISRLRGEKAAKQK